LQAAEAARRKFMKITHRRDWGEGMRSGFAGAGPNAKAYEGENGFAIVEPAEEFDSQLIGVELYLGEDAEDAVRFLCPDWDTVEFMLEALLD
jgi:hypothetical protein